MTNLKIVGWTDFESAYQTRKYNGEELSEIIYLIQNEIVNKGYIFSGEEHQNGLTGVPVFSDGTCFRASMRGWGYIMSGCYTGPDGMELSYMDFYMSLDDETVMPEFEEIDVDPIELDETSDGLIIKPDKQVIEESIALGMAFMTTDKVLQKVYEKKLNKN